jgi:hypothetical protein
MGADLSMIHIVRTEEMDYAIATKRMCDYVDTMRIDMTTFSEYEEMYSFTEDEEDAAVGVADQVRRNTIKDVIKEFIDSLDSREVTSLMVYGKEVLITGGMTWGDSPTTAYDIFDKFCRLPEEIVNVGGFSTYTSHVNFIDLVLSEFGDKMPEHLKRELIAFKMVAEL